MNTAVEPRDDIVDAAWRHERLLFSRGARVVRAVLRWVVVLPVIRWFCAPLLARGSARVPSGPVVFAANHASHADTLALLAALPRHARARTRPAAAQDYFFSTSRRGAAVSIALGAFPFPRRGPVGLARAAKVLERGDNIVLFPEGTRSAAGQMGAFKPGVGILACAGATVVPVGISGTAEVIRKNARLPRRAPVSIEFGAPLQLQHMSVEGATATIEKAVGRCAARAALARPSRRRPSYERARAFASSRAALALVFCWGVAEALAWPIVPDVAVALLAAAAPRRFVKLAAAAIAGSLCGGAIAWKIGPSFLGALPLVTDRMSEQAATWLAVEGADAVARQPWSGVPFKAFAYQASEHSALASFLGETFIARGLRFLEVGAVFAMVGILARRIAPRLYGAFAIGVLAFFFIGLGRVVAAWS